MVNGIKFDQLLPLQLNWPRIGRLMAKRPKTVGHRFTEALLQGHLDQVAIVPRITCLLLPNEHDAAVFFFHELVYTVYLYMVSGIYIYIYF